MAMTAQVYRDGGRGARETVNVAGTLRDASRVPIDVTIEDLSTTGFRMRTDALLAIDEPITIGIPGIGQSHAYVVRPTDDGFGCGFATPIDPALVAAPLDADSLVKVEFGDPLDRQLVGEWSRRTPPHVEKISRLARLATVLGLGAGSWMCVVSVIRLF